MENLIKKYSTVLAVLGVIIIYLTGWLIMKTLTGILLIDIIARLMSGLCVWVVIILIIIGIKQLIK
jgi:hypothetical protein